MNHARTSKRSFRKYILYKHIFCNFFLYSTKHQMISYAGLIFIPYFAIFCEFMPRFNFLCRKNHICAELLEKEYLEIIPFWIIWDQLWCAKMFIEIVYQCLKNVNTKTMKMEELCTKVHEKLFSTSTRKGFAEKLMSREGQFKSLFERFPIETHLFTAIFRFFYRPH